MQPSKKRILEITGAILVVSCIWIFWMNLRTGYSWDDLTSYGAANSNYSLWMPTKKGDIELSDIIEKYILGDSTEDFLSNINKFIHQTLENGYRSSDLYRIYQQYQSQEELLYWINKDDIYDYLTVNEGERFHILSILECNWEDTHPPLYHIILNAICSMFPGKMSKWFGFTLNMISLWGVCIFIYLVFFRLMNNHRSALFAIIVYGVSSGAISTVIYIRMYAMLTLMVLALLYQHLYLCDKGYRLKGKLSFFLIMNLLLGYLTQYFFCIAAVVMFGVAVYDMLHKRLYQELRKYIGVVFLSAVLSLCIWPFGIKHMFFTGRGSEAIEHFTRFNNVLFQMAGFLKVIIRQVFANVWIFLLVAIIVTVCLPTLVKKRSLDIKQAYIWIVSGVYILLVTIASPVAETRYIACIFPLLIIGVLNILCMIIKRYRFIIAIVGLIIFSICVNIIGPDYMEVIGTKEKEILEHYGDNACIYVEDIYCYQRHLVELAQYDKCLIVNWNELENIQEEQIELPEKAVLYVSSVIDEKKVVDWFRKNTQYDDISILLDGEDEYAGTSIYYMTVMK